MNTREKILTLDQARAAAAGMPVTAFVTHLEVLQADHIRALEAASAESAPGKLFLVLTDPPSPLVALEDRAEVAAGLRMVDYVVPAAAGRVPALDAIHPHRIIEDEEEDCGRIRRLIEHVRSCCAQ